MKSSYRRTGAAIGLVCAILASSCNSSSPVELDSEGEAAAIALKFEVTPLAVDFGTTATTVSVTLTNNTRKTLSWTASESAGWLTLSGTSGTIAGRSSKTLSLSVQRANKRPGTYRAKVTISAGTAGSAVVSVSMTVPTAPERFDVTPLQVSFGTSATSSSVTLTNNGTTSLSWTAVENAGWLGLAATSGTIAANSSKTLALSAQRTGMTAGTYTTKLMVSGGTAGADTASVSMTVPTSSSVTLAGQLIDQFDGHALAGITVQFDGTTTTTDGSGRFAIPGDATSTLQQLTLSGNGVYKRQTFARTGDSRWRVVPATFGMSAYNDLARDEFGPATVRWVAAPAVYIDTRPEGFTSAELSTWVSEVKAQVPAFISGWTGATMSPAAVIVTSSPPSDFTAGTIVIHFSENSNDYGGSSTTIGYARLSYTSSGAVNSSAVWLRYLRYAGTTGANKRKGILGHELGHATGLGHMGGTTTPSLMYASIGSNTDLKDFDRQAALLHYTRSPKNTSPDTDSSTSYLGLLMPAGIPATKEWLCDAGDEIPAR